MKEDRYHRQRLIEGWDQEKISSSKILLVGAGAIGCETAKNLVLAGIGELTIVDFDIVEITNLNRQFLYQEQDVGKRKADVAAKRLSELNPDVKVKGIHADITKLDKNFFSKFDLLLGCVDNILARYYINRMAVETLKPYIDAGTNVFFASLQVVLPPKTACLECHSLYRGVGRMSCIGENANPAVSTTSAVIGGIQAQEALKVLLGIETTGYHMQFDIFNNVLTVINLEKNPSCPICGNSSFEILKVESKTYDELLELLEKILGCKPILLSKNKVVTRDNYNPDETMIAIGGGRKIKLKIKS